MGRLLAEEAQAQDIHVVLGPTINLHRSVLGGRLFEAYSEDPLLTGGWPPRTCRGCRARGRRVPEAPGGQRVRDRAQPMNCVVDEATLRELYLLPFEIAIAESEPVVADGRVQRRERAPATEQRRT